jgi:hypothetical protein
MGMFLTILQCISVSMGIIEKLAAYRKNKKSANPKKSADNNQE